MSFTPGTKIDSYEILSQIGAGGMGEVYRARDTKLGRQVALKILPAAFSHDPDRLRRFDQEGRAAAALNHPNIVVLHDAGSQDGLYYVVTELLEGETLRERLAGTALPVRKAIDYGIQIARGLAAAHSKGITHRDLKPENLFITKDGVVKILDFGLAKQSGPKQSGVRPTDLATEPIETDPGKVMGTAGYMSPEQVRGQVADARSDIFSLGIVLYEMVSGKRAFTGDSSVEVMNAILKQEPAELDASLPPALDRIIRRCLEKKPEERFESARDLAFALESISGASETRGQRTQNIRSHRCLRATTAVIAAVALGSAMFLLGRLTTRTSSLSFRRVTFRRGFIDNARFANGGRTIVYSASWEGKPWGVYSTQTENPESRDLAFADARVLSISSSGELALALTHGASIFPGGTLASASIAGGAPREISADVILADWSPDGTRLAVARNVAGFQQLEFPIGHILYRTTGGIDSPRIHRQGKLVAFIDHPMRGSGAGYIAVVDDSGTKKTLSRRLVGTWGLAWTAKDEIVFCASPQGITSSLYAINLAGHERVISNLPGTFAVHDIAPDGRVLLTRRNVWSSLSYLPAVNSSESDLSWHDNSMISDIQRDNKAVLFAEGGDAETRAGYSTYLRRTDSAAAVRLGTGLALEISPDGQWALVVVPSDYAARLMLLPIGIGQPRVFSEDNIDHKGGAWTPDGKRVVFVGNEPGHGIRYWVQRLGESRPTPITSDDVNYNPSDPVVVSADGRLVAVSSQNRIVLYSLDGRATGTIPDVGKASAPLRWCPDNRTLLVHDASVVPLRIVRVDVETGEKKPWRELSPASRAGLIRIMKVRVSADCQSIAYSAMYNLVDLWIADGVR